MERDFQDKGILERGKVMDNREMATQVLQVEKVLQVPQVEMVLQVPQVEMVLQVLQVLQLLRTQVHAVTHRMVG